jgi:membrane protein DedA with SNARE-associated domain
MKAASNAIGAIALAACLLIAGYVYSQPPGMPGQGVHLLIAFACLIIALAAFFAGPQTDEV